MDSHAHEPQAHESQAVHEDEIVEQDKVPACGGRLKPDGEDDPAGEVGWFLQREREKRGLTLEAIGEHIGVHPYHIEAIEYGDMTCMPQRVEALQMISAYADFLGFHPEPLLEHYINILPVPQLAPRQHPASPAPLSSARIFEFKKHLPKLPDLKIHLPSFKMDNNGIVASVAAAFMLFAGTTWLVLPGQQPPEIINVAVEMPPADAEILPKPTAPDAAAVKITELAIEDEPLTKTDDMPVATAEPTLTEDELGAFIENQLNGDAPAETASMDAVQPAAAPAIVADTQVASVDPAPVQPAAAPSAIDARLVITAKAPVWVRIEDAQGNVVMTQMFESGDEFRVPNDRKGLVIIARDGSRLTYAIDGKDMGVMGKPGEILAGEELDAEKMLAKG
jgi:cytoskeleton protein RodZ